MGITEILLLSVSLAMDAFSVSVCKGLSMRKIDKKGAFITALFFGGFQAIMPFIGYLLGKGFESYINSFSHWIAFILLGFIGGKMIFEAINDKSEEQSEYKLEYKELTILAIATSIDALAVGVVFATEKVNILTSIAIIGAVTFAICLAGVLIGHKFGSKYEKKAEIAGGAILIIIGAKLLLEGLGII